MSGSELENEYVVIRKDLYQELKQKLKYTD